jgi:hypothetical protein
VPRDGQARRARAGLSDDRWSWAYQSAGRTPEPWAGPDLGDHLEELGARGVRDVVSVPVGFVSDHVEILFDIDHKAAAVAAGLGMRLERPPALNDDPLFIGALASSSGRVRLVAGGSARRVRVVVIGGGIAGLAAARRLEALAPRPGSRSSSATASRGKIRTERVDGFVVEAAPDSFLSRKERGVGLCRSSARRRAHRARPEHPGASCAGRRAAPAPEGSPG